MSRDWTPLESYLVEQQGIKEGRGDKWDFLSNLRYIPLGGEPQRIVSDEEIAIRKEFPVIGKFLGTFAELHKWISEFPGGVELLREKDAELSAYIEKGTGDQENYVIRWFEGKLDPNFYYSERNNELLVSEICKDAISRGMKNWIVTDPDCVQVRRQVDFEYPGVYELMQIENFYSFAAGRKGCRLSFGRINFDDYDGNEIQSILNSYGYESIPQLSKLLGDRREAYGQLAEMIFETYASDFVIHFFPSWNEALKEVADRTGLDLDAYREEKKLPLEEQIGKCEAQVEDRDADRDQQAFACERDL